MSNLKLGLTLFCFTNEYNTGKYSFEDCVRVAAQNGATGYEIVGSQMLPEYPCVSDEFLGLVNACKAKYGIGPVSYGANQDRGKLPGRDLTDDELLALTILDLKAAHKLGCKLMRVQYMMSPAAFERLAPYAEMYDVKCGIEIHNPETPTSPKMLEYVEAIKRSGSKHLGFVPDFGCFATKPNKPMWDQALAMGVDEKYLRMAAEMRYNDVPQAEAMKKLFEEEGAPMAMMRAFQGMYGFVQFRKEFDAESLKCIIPYTAYFHGKFHYLDENDKEASIPYEQILPIIAESGFDGYLIGEFEDELNCGGTEFSRQFINMAKNIIEK